MDSYTLIIVAAFVIVVAIVSMSKSLTDSMLMVSIFANFLAVTNHFCNLHKNMWGTLFAGEGCGYGKSSERFANPEANVAATGAVMPGPGNIGKDPIPLIREDGDFAFIPSAYGLPYAAWQQERNGYSTAYNAPSGTMIGPDAAAGSSKSVDNMNVALAQSRARDKRCIEGAVSKDANYYKYHYAEEFDAVENKPWWGRNEW